MTYIMICPEANNCISKSCAHRIAHAKLPSCNNERKVGVYDCDDCVPVEKGISNLERYKKPVIKGLVLGIFLFVYYQALTQIILELKY